LAHRLFLGQGKKLPEVEKNIIEINKAKLSKNIVLSKEQDDAIKIIEKSLDFYECFLLDGITGSGKTEVYKNIQNKIYEKGYQTLIIVPEKNLIPELLRYFKIKNVRVIEYHSSLTPKKKFTNWNLIQNHKVDIIIGTRSSIFLQIPKLGLIIIDEEHDTSFKNNSEARYNARDVADF
jgi:primosomal protein N' (replication factor Y)